MSKRTSRAFKATATVAGMAAFGASFAGTAAAADNSDTPTVVSDQLDGSTGESESGFDQGGLFTFDMPSLQTAGSEDFGFPSLDDSDDSDNQSENFQHPEQYEDNNFGEGDFQILGQSFDGFETPGSDMSSNNSEAPFVSHDEGTQASQNGSDGTSDFADFGGMTDGFDSNGESGPLSGHTFKMFG